MNKYEKILEDEMTKRKNQDYFEMFREGANISHRAAEALHQSIINKVIDEDILRSIKSIEHEGDLHVHKSQQIIESAFITPFDSTDMVDLLRAIENVTDAIDASAHCLYMTRIREVTASLEKFTELINDSTAKLVKLFDIFHEKGKALRENMHELVVEVNHLEEIGDQTYMRAIYNLYDGTHDALNVMRYQTVYQAMEDALDACEAVADRAERLMITFS